MFLIFDNVFVYIKLCVYITLPTFAGNPSFDYDSSHVVKSVFS